MSKIGELNLLPISKWEAYPTYYIGAGGIGYLIVSWLMHYMDQYLPANIGIQNFNGARFLTLDTASPDSYDLPPNDPARNTLFTIEGDLNNIIEEVKKGSYAGIKEFYPLSEESEVAKKARKRVGDLKDGAGTTRPFGRIGYFYTYDKIVAELEKLIRAEVTANDMRFGGKFEIITPEKGGKQRRCFFIVSSLAGGTGSSCFLDIAATLRKIHADSFSHEKWTITGVFTLAEVLAIDTKVDQEGKRKKMKANVYAALKEVNHFLAGNSFMASYGKKGDVKVKVSNKREDDFLFDLIHLVDTPNQDKSPLSGRGEVAQFIAQSLLYMGATEISKQFYNRVVDTTATLHFDTLYPPSSGDSRKVVEQQQYSFSTLGLCKLLIPTEEYIRYVHYRLAMEMLEGLQNGTPFDIAQETKQIINRCRLNGEDFDREFNQCSGSLFSVSLNLIDDLRAAQNPMDEIREQINRMIFDPKDIEMNAKRVSIEKIQSIFPKSGEGRLHEEFNQLINQGRQNDIFNILKMIEKQLEDYKKRLIDELEDAVNQVVVNENSDNASLIQQNVINDRELNQTLDAMEQEWGAWGARFIRPGYRNRFIDRYEGEINQASQLMQRMQRVAFVSSVWDVKIKTVEELLTKVKNLSVRYKGSYLQSVKQWFLDKTTPIERGLSTKSRFLQLAIEPKEFYEQLFPLLIGNKDHLVEQLVMSAQTGLSLDGKSNVTQSDWEAFTATQIAEAIVNLVKDTVTPQFPVSDDIAYSSSPEYYKIDLNNPYFLSSKEISKFYTNILSDWKRKAQMSLLFANAPPEAQRYVVSGCRADSSPDSWSDVLNLSGLSTLQGGTPNQAILLTLALGFPLTNLKTIEDWFSQQYIPLKRQGWPLHLFQEEVVEMMTEPYLDWISLPDIEQAKELYKEAKELKILSEIQSGDDKLTYWDKGLLRRLPAKIQDFFFDYPPQPKSYDRNDLLDVLRKESDLLSPLKHSLVSYNPTMDEEEKWDERKKVINGNEENDIEEILAWLQEAKLLSSNSLDQLEFDTNLFADYAGSAPKFCHFFFKRVAIQKRITKRQFIAALASHEPLSRWITKKALRALISPEKLNSTRNRYQEGGFSDYLRSALVEMLPIGN